MRLIRFLFGLFGLAALLVAAVALAAEVKTLVDTGTLFAKPLGKIWFDVHKDSLLLVQPAIERYLHPWLWGGIVQPLLERPPVAAAGAFAVLGVILALFGRLFRGRAN